MTSSPADLQKYVIKQEHKILFILSSYSSCKAHETHTKRIIANASNNKTATSTKAMWTNIPLCAWFWWAHSVGIVFHPSVFIWCDSSCLFFAILPHLLRRLTVIAPATNRASTTLLAVWYLLSGILVIAFSQSFFRWVWLRWYGSGVLSLCTRNHSGFSTDTHAAESNRETTYSKRAENDKQHKITMKLTPKKYE